MWECQCQCGNKSIVRGHDLRRHHTTSCGKCNYYSTSDDGYMICKTWDGREFIFDAEDYEFIRKSTWHIDAGRRVVCSIRKSQIKLHRLILNINDPKIQIDHINRDSLDNRKENLRLCNNIQNHWNIAKQKNSTHTYKGTTLDKRRNKWCARITVNGECLFLGYFNTEKDAAIAYNKAAISEYKEFACLNDIQEEKNDIST